MQTYNPSVMKRIQEIDLLKAVAIIAMVFIHVYDASTNLQINTPLDKTTVWILEFMGNIPSAGVFMFAMGWGAAFSSRSTPKTYVSRLKQLVLLGIVINFFEQCIPCIIDPATFGTVWENAPSIIAVDIYFFAAFAMLYFAAMKGLKKRPKSFNVYNTKTQKYNCVESSESLNYALNAENQFNTILFL